MIKLNDKNLFIPILFHDVLNKCKHLSRKT